ncbi:MAG: hypothetical protein HND44_13005 [Chloroflexi bacterium]|nr:hypothetical protein [Ardenticatenaceae bacterium]MBL1129397.1 hypothetical protein [Chloroflexota bacterium]NOG35477.1 hypothetical protein [Chloroflexota bacterium]GIK57426.1 MAG: hypothetical protein BroJett015_30890 [Chloroflexota bacterium]
MNILGAIIAGVVGTIVITMVMAMAPKMGMPKMDIVGMLGSMFSPESNRTLGMAMHLMMGVVFAILYALAWNTGLGTVSLLWGAVFGAIHWLIAGAMMGGMGMMHAGIKAGAMPNPGVFMLHNGGMMAFMGGLMGHVIFGLVVALVYGLFV